MLFYFSMIDRVVIFTASIYRIYFHTPQSAVLYLSFLGPVCFSVRSFSQDPAFRLSIFQVFFEALSAHFQLSETLIHIPCLSYELRLVSYFFISALDSVFRFIE